MCSEDIAVALCAPVERRALSYTCSKLHLIASNRHVCFRAKGNCVCFFGTCGTVERTFDSVFDLTDLPKVRCSVCTVREDDVGHSSAAREILESPVPTRKAIPEEGLERYMRTLKSMWGSMDHCPYHVTEHENQEMAAHHQGDAETNENESEFYDQHDNGSRQPNDDGDVDTKPRNDNENETSEPPKEESPRTYDPVKGELRTDDENKASETTNHNKCPQNNNVVNGDDGIEDASDEVEAASGAEDSPKTSDSASRPMTGIEASQWAPRNEAPNADLHVQAPADSTPPSPAPKAIAASRPPTLTAEKIASMKEFLRMN
ncbi:hypothetical protein ACRE_064880 [Hapsidospora chrysogenum ATCC 11550]|uniref:Uncharacterized protein n=1 Tax=Hapsidospora chrysogenum (strain ATCC 11550 / CBS 779.69 / DSM 880 / IAM 14645 / JCM 23072 / IMI 49137) TaxID=857340 RepID=A0A086T0A4_HAPC1|nr:hypothetical protein ACRE_064880 [Hapsidospora chrysogenum ATCC 11550]